MSDTRHRRILFSIAFATFMVNVDTFIVNIALPTIARDFAADTAAVAWVSLSYQLAVTALLLVCGALGDRLGLRRVFMAGYAVFTLGSVLCGLAPTLGWLLAARCLQGIGASALYALTPAMVPKFLPAAMRGPAFGVLATVAALGITVGTPLGGLLTSYASWRWAFLINLPVGIAAMLVCRAAIPDDRSDGDARPPFDYPGALLSFLGIFLLIYALESGTEHGWATWRGAGVLTGAGVALLLLLWREHHAAKPLFDPRLLRDAVFMLGNAANFLGFVFLAGTNFLLPFYLEYVQGLTTGEAGMVYLVYAAVYMAVGPLAGRLANRVAPRHLCTVAMGVGTVNALLFAVTLPAPGLTAAIVYLILQGLTFATFIPSNNNVVMGMAPPGAQGSVSALFRMINRTGMACGVSLFAACFAFAVPHADPQTVSRAAAVAGTRYAYLAGAAACGIAMLTSLLAGVPADTKTHAQ